MEGESKKEEEETDGPKACVQVPVGNVKGLLDRLSEREEVEEAKEESSSWSSWGSWAGSALSSISASAVSSISAISVPDAISSLSVTDAINKVTNEAQAVLNETLVDLNNLASKSLEKAASVASAVENALGLEDDRSGFAQFFVQSGGLELNDDLKELSHRSAEAVSSMGLPPQLESDVRSKVTSYRGDDSNGDDDATNKDDAIASVNGIDVSSISEAMKQHNLILVEAHAKLVQELKKLEKKDDDAVAATAVSNKNKMEQLFSLGAFELLKRSFILISNQADILSANYPEVANAIERESAVAVAPEDVRSIEKLVEPLKLLRLFLRQKLWAFQKNYSQMIRSLPELIEPFSSSAELVNAMNQLTQATQAEIILDTETAQTILENCFELLDNLLILNATIKIAQ